MQRHPLRRHEAEDTGTASYDVAHSDLFSQCFLDNLLQRDFAVASALELDRALHERIEDDIPHPKGSVSQIATAALTDTQQELCFSG